MGRKDRGSWYAGFIGYRVGGLLTNSSKAWSSALRVGTRSMGL